MNFLFCGEYNETRIFGVYTAGIQYHTALTHDVGKWYKRISKMNEGKTSLRVFRLVERKNSIIREELTRKEKKRNAPNNK